MQTLSSKQKYYAGIVLVCLLIVATIFIWRHELHHTTTTTNKNSAVIDITSSGFVPSTVKIRSGTAIVWQNQDGATHTIASNPYPVDNSVPGLKSGTILPHGSYRYTPSTVGTIHYHDDTKPTLNGTIVVSN